MLGALLSHTASVLLPCIRVCIVGKLCLFSTGLHYISLQTIVTRTKITLMCTELHIKRCNYRTFTCQRIICNNVIYHIFLLPRGLYTVSSHDLKSNKALFNSNFLVFFASPWFRNQNLNKATVFSGVASGKKCKSKLRYVLHERTRACQTTLIQLISNAKIVCLRKLRKLRQRFKSTIQQYFFINYINYNTTNYSSFC